MLPALTSITNLVSGFRLPEMQFGILGFLYRFINLAHQDSFNGNPSRSTQESVWSSATIASAGKKHLILIRGGQTFRSRTLDLRWVQHRFMQLVIRQIKANRTPSLISLGEDDQIGRFRVNERKRITRRTN